MKTVRIFISSPGDVAEERQKAREVIAQLQRRYGSSVILQPVLWEDLPLKSDASFQEGIDLILSGDRGIDIAVFLLWSRLGSPLGAMISKPDGSPYLSGTEREWDLMLRARAASGGLRPDILTYVRDDQEGFIQSLRARGELPSDKLAEMVRQRSLVEQFVIEQFYDTATKTSIRAYHTFREPITFAHRLRTHLRALLDERVADQNSREALWDTVEKGSPFRGLEVFEYEHAPLFFGREQEICEVQIRLREQAAAGCAFVLVVGASGSGKSSLARAGVAPAVAEFDAESDAAEWRRAIFTPGVNRDNLLLGLARALASDTAFPELAAGSVPSAPSALSALSDLAEGLARDPDLTFRFKLRPLFEGKSRKRLLLIFDQIEELFTQGEIGVEQRRQLGLALSVLAKSGSVWVLGTVRSDYYARFQETPELLAMKGDRGQYDLLAPQMSELRRIIAEPARAAGLRYEENDQGETLDARLLKDAAANPEGLPLLEFCLDTLHQRQAARGDRLLRWADYDAMKRMPASEAECGAGFQPASGVTQAESGLAGALVQRAEETLDALPREHQRQCLSAIFGKLLDLSAGEQETPVRRLALEKELLRNPFADGELPGARAFVDAFVAGRLLVLRQDGAGRSVVMVAHEALLRNWWRLKKLQTQFAEFLRIRSQVERSHADWEHNEKEKSFLIPDGLPLQLAAKLAKEAPELLPQELAVFIALSIARADRIKNTRRWLVGAAMCVLALMAGFASFKQREAKAQQKVARSEQREAEIQKQRAEVEAKKARDRALEAEIANKRNRRQLRAASMADLASALKAWQEDFEAEQKGQRSSGFQGKSKWHEAVALLTRALESDPTNGRAEEWLYTTLLHQAHAKRDWADVKLLHEDAVWSASFSPDGSKVLTASLDGTARLWDATTGKPIGEPMRHEAEVICASFSPDGSKILTASWKGTARLWDATTGQPLGQPMRYEGIVASASFSPDGSKVVTASNDKTARLWDANTGKPIGQPMRHADSVNNASFSPDGSKVVTASDDNSARLWDANTGKPIGQPMRHAYSVNTASFSPDGRKVVTAGDDNSARLWDAITGKPLAQPMRHENSVRSASFSPDGSKVLTASWDGTARLWDATTGKLLGQPMDHAKVVYSASFSPDGSKVITASADQTARLWDATTGEPLGQPMRHENWVNSASFSPDGSKVVTASSDHSARLWDATTGQPLGDPLRHAESVNNASFSADGSKVVTASSDKTAQLWDATTVKPLGQPMRHPEYVIYARFSPDGSKVVTLSDDNNAQLWDATTGRPLGEPMHHANVVYTASFSPDGSKVITACHDKTARLWNATTGKSLGQPIRHEDVVTNASFSPNGSKVVTASYDKTARLWDATTDQPLGQPMRHEGSVFSASFSPDGSKVLTASSDGTARLWDATKGQPLGQPMRHAESVGSACFSPDGSKVLTASDDKTARLWDATTGQPLGQPMRHGSSVESASFSPDGSKVVTVSLDNNARLWDAATGKPLGEPMRHEDRVGSACFSPDGSKVLTASWDGTARLWDLTTEQQQKEISVISKPILEWAWAISGLRFNADGELETIPDDERRAAIFNPNLPAGPWRDLAQWLNTPAPARTLSPASKNTLREVAERERDFNGNGTIESLQSALKYDPTLPLARLLLAEAKQKANENAAADIRDASVPQQAALLRRYDLDRLEAENGKMKREEAAALWARAAEILLLRPGAKVGVGVRVTLARDEALKAAERALALDPENPNALRQKGEALAALKQGERPKKQPPAANPAQQPAIAHK